MEKLTKRKMQVTLFGALLGIAATISGYFIAKPTTGSKYYDLANVIYPTNPLKAWSYKCNFVRITKSKDKVEKDTSPFYTSIVNFFTGNYTFGDTRQILSNSVVDQYNEAIKLTSASTLTVSEVAESDGTYSVGKNYFSSLYCHEILTTSLSTIRYGAEGYVFVNETYANKLLKKYNISSYEALIQDQKYCLLDLNIDGERTAKVCINSIIKNGKYLERRIAEVYGSNVAVIGLSTAVKEWARVSLDVDIRANSINVSNTLLTLNKYSYSLDNCEYQFLLRENQTYKSSDKALNIYKDIFYNTSNETLYSILIVLLCALTPLYYIVIYMKKEEYLEASYSVYIFLVELIVCSIITLSLNVYSLINVVPLLGFIVVSILSGKEVGKDAKKVFSFISRKNK